MDPRQAPELRSMFGKRRFLRAIVTAFSAVVLSRIDLQDKSVTTLVLETNRGIYYGLTRCDGRILVAARSLDIAGRVQTPDSATNSICSLAALADPMTPVLGHECL